MGRQRLAREEICNELEDVESFRSLAADLRDNLLMNLDEYLSMFIEKAEKAGVHVHLAEDGDQARKIIRSVADDNGVKKVVKSKSMITEEIELSPYLERAGIEAVETDLGEFIIQLLEEKPSHIVIPALHLSAEQVRRIFEEKIGYSGGAEPEILTRAARVYLRGKFKEAQMGISGVNFAIAEDGAWSICTNEGNGRYVAGMPEIYLAVMGMERIVKDLSSAAVILKLLGRFATGQRITQYVNFVNGPTKTLDGPKEVHLVILDNGRSRILGSKYWRILRCIRCGACLNVCPVFSYIGGQSFPGCYSGPMGSVLLPLQKGLEKAGEAAKACTLCGICDQVCPVKIPLTKMLLDIRSDLSHTGSGRAFEKGAMKSAAWIFQHPLAYRFSKRLLRRILSPLSESGWIKNLVSLPGRWTDEKDLPMPAKRSFLEKYGCRRPRDEE